MKCSCFQLKSSLKYSKNICKQCNEKLISSLEFQQTIINNQARLHFYEDEASEFQLENIKEEPEFDSNDDQKHVEMPQIKTECFEFGSIVAQTWMGSNQLQEDSSILDSQTHDELLLTEVKIEHNLETEIVSRTCSPFHVNTSLHGRPSVSHLENTKSFVKTETDDEGLLIEIPISMSQHDLDLRNAGIRHDLVWKELDKVQAVPVPAPVAVAKLYSRKTCDTCGKQFCDKNALKKHVNGVHLKKKPFVCPICGKAFSRKANLKYHEGHLHK